jgi:hypothetical protein
MTRQFLDVLPIWAVYPVTAAILLVFMEGGYRYARSKQHRAPAKSDAGVGAISGATLALLAFLLAFVVGFGVSVLQERRHLVVNEANAIGTTYLRAGYLDEPYQTESRNLLSEYTDWRIAATDKDKLAEAKARSEEIHVELWAIAEEVVGESNSATTGLYISSLNDVIDLHTERVVAGLQIRIPPMVLLAMYLIALAAMFLVGAQTGYTDKRNLIALFTFVLVLSVVLYLIVDLDRSQQGLLQVSHQPLIDLQSSLPTYP